MKKYYLNLQLFAGDAGEKTEEATPKRKEDSRKKGQVLKSRELNSVILLFVVFLLLRFYMPIMLFQIEGYINKLWSQAFVSSITIENTFPLLIDVVFMSLTLLAPILFFVVLAGVTANLVQVGFLFSTDTIEMKLSRINPIEGFKKIFSKKSLAELVKSVSKITMVGYLAYSTIAERINEFPYLMDKSLVVIMTFVGNILFTILWKVIILLFFLAVMDYVFQKYEFETSIKMSKQEVKDEHKNIEGDPQVKGKIKAKQRQMSMNRMMQEVPNADVIITNPTHFAIAIKYDPTMMQAPKVVAKGLDLVALRIKKIAKENNVITVENKPLAQVLYKNVDINENVPEDLFQAVAEILAYVYRLKGKG